MSYITVAGAAAVWDYIFPVDRLPEAGDIVNITRDCDKPLPGGCAPNIALGLARLSGYQPALYYPVGCEFPDSGLKDTWLQQGIDCSQLTYVPDVRSGYAWMFMQPGGSTMCFSYAGAAKEALPALTEDIGEWVIVAPVFNQFTEAVLKKAIESNKKLIISGICSRTVIPSLASAYAVIINIHEAEILAAHKGCKTIDELALGMEGVILYVTHGGKGSVVYNRGQTYNIPLIPAEKVQDFTGAGDAYTSGVASALIRNLSPVDAAYVGSANASFVVEEFGGQSNLPDMEALKKRLALYAPEIAKNI